MQQELVNKENEENDVLVPHAGYPSACNFAVQNMFSSEWL